MRVLIKQPMCPCCREPGVPFTKDDGSEGFCCEECRIEITISADHYDDDDTYS